MDTISDQDSQEAVIRRYSNMVYRLSFARTGNTSDAEDLYQEVFLRYLTKAPLFASEEHRKAWLLKVTVNCANRFHAMRGRRRTEPLSQALSVPAPEGEGLWEELRRLPKRDRTILHLYYYEDLTTEEIAQILERNPATVRSQLLRARNRLKKLLLEEGYGMRKEYKRMMDQLSPREELVQDLISQVNKEHGTRRFWMHKKKFFLALAAALVVLTGSAVAVANSLGVLDLFFQGDTSQLQPYVQTGVDCTETEDYRLTLDSSLYDGQMIYAVITVTGLNDPAIAALKNNQVIAESHRDFWGQETVDALMESGSTGPDTFWAYIPEDGEQNTQRMPRISSLGSKDLPSPSDSSRSWQVDITLDHFVGELESPLELCLNFMGREHSVSIPLTHIAEPIRLTPNLEVTTNPYTGRRGILKEFILTPVSYSVRTESLDGQSDSAGLSVGELLPRDLFFLRMKDGSVLTRTQLGESNRQFELAVDLNQVQSIIYGYTEFPVDGSQPFPADLDAHLYPFFCTIFPTQDGVWRVSLEELCRGLGAEYRWEEEVQTATAVYRGTTVQMTAGSAQVLVDGESVELTYTALDENGTEFVNTLPVTLENGNLIVAASVLLDAWNISMGTIWDEGHYTLEGLVVTP